MAAQNCRILQIVPAAPDWRAIFADENQEGLVIETQLAAWALVERNGHSRSVVGMDATGEVQSCEALENFLGYAPPGETASRWHREAVQHFRDRTAGDASAASQVHRLDALQVAQLQRQAIQARDWSHLASLYHEQSRYVDPDVTLLGCEAIVARAIALEAPFADASFDITDEFDCGDRVATAWRYRAVNHGRLTMRNGIELPPTGRAVDIHGVSLFTVKEGLITSETSTWDSLSLFGQLGLLSDPGLFGSW